jgi:hypothetical protein
MSKQTSFEYQIELAEELKKWLHGLQERLGAVANDYMKKCNDLADAGMMEEDWLKFTQDYAQVTYHKIEDVVKQINECDISFIEKYIAYLASR